MRKVVICDADLLDKSRKHRFPNLACMKMAGWLKQGGVDVRLASSWDDVRGAENAYVSKVFGDTPSPEWLLDAGNVVIGGTGFHDVDAEPLPHEIEHAMPLYSLYDGADIRKADRNFYDNYSIGYLTRGCFRKCPFCVNRKYARAEAASPVEEFMDASRPKLCFIDDNFLAYPKWRDVIETVLSTGKKFRFMQGLDERLLTEDAVDVFFSKHYDGTPHFAFDDWADRDIIASKAELIRSKTDKIPMFYVLVGFDREGRYDEDFWERDIRETFDRIDMLRSYKFLPYIMRYERYVESPYRGIYIQLARWCNQPSIFKKKSFDEYIAMTKPEKAPTAYFEEFKKRNESVDRRSLHLRW